MAIDTNADFTPTIPDSGVVPVKSPYNPTGSFKFWAQKVIPLVYDDSLSYYEVLCKVVTYLNNVIQNVDNLNDSVNSTNASFETLEGYVNTTKDTLINTYNELQNYVNTYFDNLDVQQEINAKLDTMADSGELSNLLAPFIPDLVTQWLNNHVTPTSPIIDNTLSISGAGADAKVTGDKLADLKDDISVGLGTEAYTKTFTSDGELAILYPEANAVYNVYVKELSGTTLTIFKFTDSGTSTLMTITSAGHYTIFGDSTANYYRLYITNVAQGARIEASISKIASNGNVLCDTLTALNAELTSNNLSLLNVRSVSDLPSNCIYKITNSLTQQDLTDLPAYGKAGTITVFAVDGRPYATRFKTILVNYQDDETYIAFYGTSLTPWKRVDNNDTDIANYIKSAYGIQMFSKSITVGYGEIGKIYADGSTYHVYVNGTPGSEVDLYAFNIDGTYQTVYRKKPVPFRYDYTPTEESAYLRVYANNDYPIEGVAMAVKADYDQQNIVNLDSLSNEFCAVRKFTVIGDSMASGYYQDPSNNVQYPRNLDYSWAQIMARMNGQTAVNATQSGATCASWWDDTDGYCKSQVTANNRSQIYIMGLGTNDYKDITEITPEIIGSSADINVTDYTQNADSFWGNYAKILQYVHSVAPNAIIICLTIPKPRPETEWKEQAIREITSQPLFADYVVLCDLVKDYTWLINDDMLVAHHLFYHFSAAGYANSAKALNIALSLTMRRNASKFIALPRIPFDD